MNGQCADQDCPYMGSHTPEDREQMDEIAREELAYEPR